jgi:hypothetical protein
MDTAEAQLLAEGLMVEHGLDGWTFQWSKSRRTFGDCHYSNKRIRLSRPFVELNDDDQVRREEGGAERGFLMRAPSFSAKQSIGQLVRR